MAELENAAPSMVIKGGTLRKLTQVESGGRVVSDLYPIRAELAKVTLLVKQFERENPDYTPAMLSEFITRELQARFPKDDEKLQEISNNIGDLNKKLAERIGDPDELKELIKTAWREFALYQQTMPADLSVRKSYSCVDRAAMATWVANDAGHDVDLVIGYLTEKDGVCAGYHAYPVIYKNGRANPQDSYVIETMVDKPENAYREVVYSDNIVKGGKLVTRHEEDGQQFLSCYGTEGYTGLAFNETLVAISSKDTGKIKLYEEINAELAPKYNHSIEIKPAIVEIGMLSPVIMKAIIPHAQVKPDNGRDD